MLKKILTCVVSVGFFLALSAGVNSCAPTAPTEPATTLISAPSSLTLSKIDSSASSSVGLSCGCTFKLTVTGYGGDTNLIHFSFGERLDTMITTHNLSAMFYPLLPHSGSDTVNAWIGLYYRSDSTASNSGTPLYDTLRVTATY